MKSMLFKEEILKFLGPNKVIEFDFTADFMHVLLNRRNMLEVYRGFHCLWKIEIKTKEDHGQDNMQERLTEIPRYIITFTIFF